MPSIPVITPSQASEWDAAAVVAGCSLRALVETAGRAVAHIVIERFHSACRQGVLVACGPGNNGADGWVCARALHAMGVAVWVAEPVDHRGELAESASRAAIDDGVRRIAADGPWPGFGLAIDALLGSGARGELSAPIAAALQRIREHDVPVVAIDAPTGLDLSTGADHGAVPAALTVTFGGARRGQLLARDEVGTLCIVDIGLPPALREWSQLVSAGWAAQRVTPFSSGAHKGSRGRVVVVGGGAGMTGAARMSTRSAFATGAGLVHLVAPLASLTVTIASEPDVQTLPHDFVEPLSYDLAQLLSRADATVVGPGLGRQPERANFVLSVVERTRRVVIDADALMVLRDHRDALSRLGRDREIVLTPHVGEFRALFPDHAHGLETAPWDAATAAARDTGCTVVLKGVPTVVAGQQGISLTVAAGNPALATGGSGDVLAGIIGTFLAQRLPAVDAAAVAAQALGDAADIAARRTSVRSVRPVDVIAALGSVWHEWSLTRATPEWRPPLLRELPAPVRT